MEIDFAKIDFTKRPAFILRDMDGKALKPLTHALNPTGTFAYTNTSEISFNYPNQADDQILEEYDLLTDMRILDVRGYGQFVLKNPKETDDGVFKIKECHFYSLEYEFTNKTITLEEGTYNFWNPLAPNGTIMGMILSEMPSWSIDSISTKLIGKYRTFNIDNQNILDLMRSELQEKYGCIFSFDTYNRKIIVRSVDDEVEIKPVYLSTKNLLKEIEVSYKTEDIVTVLDVNGADGVNIRSVNPMGTNRIYNLDRYMNTNYFSETIIKKWNAWKANYKSYQQIYYDLVIERQMQMSRYQAETAALGTLNGEMQSLEKKRAVIIQAIANDSALQSDLDAVNAQIEVKQRDINEKSSVISKIEIGITTLTNRLSEINNLTAFEAFFDDENDLLTLDKYFRCGTLTDSSFVATELGSYGTDDISKILTSAIFNLTNLTTLRRETHDGNMTFYSIRGGRIQQSGADFNIDAQIVNGTLQVNEDQSFVFSLYMSNGTLNETSFPSATLSMTGSITSVLMNDEETLQFRVNDSTVFITQAVTEYQKMSIEWELYEYGVACLKKLSLPTYSFTVDSSNFFVLDDFVSFAKQFKLGEKIYLHLSDRVISPIVIGVSLDFDDPTSLELDFGDTFSLSNEPITFKDFLEQSISMGSSLDFNQFNYSNFVNSGAQTSVKSFMESAIDTMKNAILSGDHNEIKIDPTGLRLRKYDEEIKDYDPRQVWATNNAIMFTSDNWQTAEIGIGEFVDKNLGSLFGIVAPALVGTILAGSQLVIESEKQDGGVAVFKMDAEGASLHNASFNLYGTTGGRIDLGADFGIVGGGDRNSLFVYNDKGQPIGVKTKNGKSVIKIADIETTDEVNASFWVDMFGDALFRGTVQAADFLDANGNSMLKNGKWDSNYLDLGNIILDGETGNISMTGNLNLSQLGSITWNAKTAPVQYQFSVNGISDWHTDMTDSDMYRQDSLDGGTTWGNAYQFRGKDGRNGSDGSDATVNFTNILNALKEAASTQTTFITATKLGAPNIYGANIYGANVYSNNFTVMPEDKAESGEWNGGFSLYAYYGDYLREMLKISYINSDGYVPTVIFQSGSIGAFARWTFQRTEFTGKINFSQATVEGLDITAKFG